MADAVARVVSKDLMTSTAPRLRLLPTLLATAVLGAGGLAQVFAGAMTYLMPVVVGGGPEAARTGMRVLETGGVLRATVRNAALLLVTLAGAGEQGLGALWWALVLACYAVDVVAFALAGVAQVRARRAGDMAPTGPGTSTGTSAGPGASTTSGDLDA